MRSIYDQIVENVVASLAAGTSMTVRKEMQMPESGADGDCVVVAGNATPLDSPPCGFDEFLLKLAICCYVVAIEAEDVDERLSAAASEVRKALRQDVHRGGLAVNTRMNRADEFRPQHTPPVVMVVVEVQYRTRYGDPYSQE